MGERAACYNKLERSTANSNALILFQVQDVSRLSTDFVICDSSRGPCCVSILSLLMLPCKHAIVCCHNSNFLASLLLTNASKLARLTYIAHEVVEVQGIATLLAGLLRGHIGTLGALD